MWLINAENVLRFVWQNESDEDYKRGWADKIMKICGVSPGVLNGKISLVDIPVAVRMSWAAGWNTTRKEDEAYCLLGIFNVNMPMLYGEGPKAFLRLQEEIIKENPDMSIFAWIERAFALWQQLITFEYPCLSIAWPDSNPSNKISSADQTCESIA
jgi:hypothetical protein